MKKYTMLFSLLAIGFSTFTLIAKFGLPDFAKPIFSKRIETPVIYQCGNRPGYISFADDNGRVFKDSVSMPVYCDSIKVTYKNLLK